MKKGFTMIELIFVIVILGILAAVAIPRLTATRDDAEISKAATNITTLISDLGAYYTSQNRFAGNLNEMTNVQLDPGTGLTSELKAAGKKCLKVTVTEGDEYKPSVIVVENGADATGAAICKKIVVERGVKHLIDESQKNISYLDGTDTNQSVQGIPVAGMRVVR